MLMSKLQFLQLHVCYFLGGEGGGGGDELLDHPKFLHLVT